MAERTLSGLVAAAGDGDDSAWSALVDRFSGLVWATTRAHRLSTAEAGDAAQTTWLRLVENLDRIQDPERVGAWLATTARRESLRQIRLRGRETLAPGDDSVFDVPSGEPVESCLLARDRSAALRLALARIGERCQELLRMLVAVDTPSYDEISAALGMPVGAIGPTRARCLEKLRRSPELAGLGQP